LLGERTGKRNHLQPPRAPRRRSCLSQGRPSRFGGRRDRAGPRAEGEPRFSQQQRSDRRFYRVTGAPVSGSHPQLWPSVSRRMGRGTRHRTVLPDPNGTGASALTSKAQRPAPVPTHSAAGRGFLVQRLGMRLSLSPLEVRKRVAALAPPTAKRDRSPVPTPNARTRRR